MNISNLVFAVIVASLLAGNVACACDKLDSGLSRDGHHQHQVSNPGHQAPCDHQRCDSCSSLESSCTSTAEDAAFLDRDTRLHALQKDLEPDHPDLESAPIDTGQPRASPPLMVVMRGSYEPPAFPSADTPILRKDQLTE